MSDDVRRHDGPAIIITTSDGTLFSCTPSEMGGVHVRREVRWRLTESSGLEHVGPPYSDESPDGLQVLVEAWWAEKKALGRPA